MIEHYISFQQLDLNIIGNDAKYDITYTFANNKKEKKDISQILVMLNTEL